MKRSVISTACALAAIWAMATGPARSEGLEVSFKAGEATVTADDAKVTDVITQLAAAGGFDLDLANDAAQTDTVSLSYRGRIEPLLSKLLGSQSYVVRYAADAPNGIAAITIYGDAVEQDTEKRHVLRQVVRSTAAPARSPEPIARAPARSQEPLARGIEPRPLARAMPTAANAPIAGAQDPVPPRPRQRVGRTG